MRAYIDALRDRSLLEEVSNDVSPATRVLLRNPPPALAWIPLRHFLELETSVWRLRDVRTVRAIGYDLAERAALPVARPVIQSLLQVLDVTPAHLLSKAGTVMRILHAGYELTTEAETPTSCIVRARLPGQQGVTEGTFHSLAGSLELTFRLCRVRGESLPPKIISLEEPEATILLQWSR